MTPQDQTTIDECVGRTLHDSEGKKIGEITDVYLDNQSRQPEWFTVKTGMFGSKVGFVPTQGSSWQDDDTITVAYTKDQIKGAPHIDADGELSAAEETDLYAYYGIGADEPPPPSSTAGEAGGTITRSEEELSVGTRQREAGSVRLRKYVETEHKTVTVPVKREKLRIERTAAKPGDSPDEIGEDDTVITLSEEVPVVEKVTVAKEHVTIGKDVETDEREVSADVRKEKIDVEETSARD
jgi:uncharacterized protein (TIGR02271 family)